MGKLTLQEFFNKITKMAGKKFTLFMPRQPGRQFYRMFTGKSGTFKQNRRKGL